MISVKTQAKQTEIHKMKSRLRAAEPQQGCSKCRTQCGRTCVQHVRVNGNIRIIGPNKNWPRCSSLIQLLDSRIYIQEEHHRMWYPLSAFVLFLLVCALANLSYLCRHVNYTELAMMKWKKNSTQLRTICLAEEFENKICYSIQTTSILLLLLSCICHRVFFQNYFVGDDMMLLTGCLWHRNTKRDMIYDRLWRHRKSSSSSFPSE